LSHTYPVDPEPTTPLEIEVRTSRNQVSTFIEESRKFEQGQSCIIQDNRIVESRNLLNKSEGQPSKPTFTVGVDVIATPFSSPGRATALVRADRDDPLVKQETMSQLNCEEPQSRSNLEQGSETSLDQSSLYSNADANLQISKASRFVGCSIVKSVPQILRREERQVRLKDCEGSLKKDSRFWWVTDQMEFYGPGPERNKIVDEFWKSAYDNNNNNNIYSGGPRRVPPATSDSTP
jgi:hypothetical protein